MKVSKFQWLFKTEKSIYKVKSTNLTINAIKMIKLSTERIMKFKNYPIQILNSTDKLFS